MERKMDEINADLRISVKNIVIKRLILKIHLTAFLLTNLLLFLLNQIGDASYQWWPWATTGWLLVISPQIYLFLSRKSRTPLNLHLFFFIMLNLYLTFLDIYSDYHYTWAWIPLLGWGIFLIAHIVITRDITGSAEKILIYAVIISDSVGKTLISVEQKPQFMKDVLKMTDANIELIPMCINAILSFTKEINMLNCDDMRLQNKNMKIVSYAAGELVCTGFISVDTNSSTAREIFKRILDDLHARYKKDIEAFLHYGITTPFLNYKLDVQKLIEIPLVH